VVTVHAGNTAAAPASDVKAIIRSPTNMAAADVSAVDFNKMTSLDRPAACGHVRWGRSASQSTASNASAVVIGRKKSREYLICQWPRRGEGSSRAMLATARPSCSLMALRMRYNELPICG